MSVPLYKDLDKSANDLITRGFPVDSFGFELDTTNASKIDFKVTHKTSNLFEKSEEVQSENVLETTRSWPERGLSLKTSVKGQKKGPTYTVEASLKDKLVKGLKSTVTQEFVGDKSNSKLSLNYFHQECASVDVLASYQSTPEISASVVAAYQALKFGFSSKVALESKKPNVSEYNLKVLYTPSKSFLAGLFFSNVNNKKTTGLKFYHDNAERKLQVAGDVVADVEKLSEVPTFRVALSQQTDANTVVKARYQSKDSSIALSLKQVLSDTTTATVGLETSKLGSNGTKFGTTINLKF